MGMDFIILGNGITGVTAAKTHREAMPDSNISIFTDEDFPFYNKLRLAGIISGKMAPEKLILNDEEWYRGMKIHLIRERVVSIDPNEKKIRTENGEYHYDKLLLGTGGGASRPPVEGIDGKDIFTLRTMKDAIDIKAKAESSKEVLILGGGVLGMEVAEQFVEMGIETHVIEMFDRLMPRQLDDEGSSVLVGMLEKKGFIIHLGKKAGKIFDENGSKVIEFSGGERMSGDLIIVSAGMRPNMALAVDAGIKTNRGILVNERMETNITDIYAGGDVAEFKGIVYGLWKPCMEQAKVAGLNMAGVPTSYLGTKVPTFLSVAGINLVSTGDISGKDAKEYSFKDDNSGVYKKLFIKDGKVIGGILLGDISNSGKLEKLIFAETDVSGKEDGLIEKGFEV